MISSVQHVEARRTLSGQDGNDHARLLLTLPVQWAKNLVSRCRVCTTLHIPGQTPSVVSLESPVAIY
jgi:hypothetical protein